jgi:hypothetical protein
VSDFNARNIAEFRATGGKVATSRVIPVVALTLRRRGES